MPQLFRRIRAGGTTLATVLVLTGCSKLPEGRSAVDAVSVRGADKVAESDVTDQLATTPTPKFLGLFRGVVYDYEIFDPHALQRDLARVERYYRARGYYDAHARAGRFLETSTNHVRVEIVVEEGEPVNVDEVAFEGTDGLPSDVSDVLERAVKRKLRRGRPFDEDRFKEAETDARRALTDRGYAYAKVSTDANVDPVRHQANVRFRVDAGPPAKFGKITLAGLDAAGAQGARGAQEKSELPEDKLRGAIDIHEGDPYSTAAIDEATQALLDLGVFASVEIVPDLGEASAGDAAATPETQQPTPPTPETPEGAAAPEKPPKKAPSETVPLTVKLEPTRLRSVEFGGGVEFDQIKTDLHGLIGWEDHDFLGGLRDFTVELRPGVVLYPTRINHLVAPDQYLPEERLRLQLRQPGFLEPRTAGIVRPELNVFPLLVKTDPSPDDPVIGYVEAKGAAGVDRSWGKLFYASLLYNAQVEAPFAYKGDLDPALRLLVISYPELATQLDLRDDRIHPHAGLFVGNNLQVAGGPFFGDAHDVKIQPELRTYVPLHRRWTFATRASLGFLFPFNYGDVVRSRLSEPLTDANRAERVRDIETVYFRGFFSGGASSNRGFPIRGIAPHGVVPFLNPATAAQQVALSCEPSAVNNFQPDPGLCSIPIGGFTLWELSNEIRTAISGPFSTAIFCDMSDVSPGVADVRLTHLHLSCGLGARYDTLVGPIRLDVGYRVQPLQVIGFASEDDVVKSDPTEGVQPKLLGLPIAVAIAIGEAF